MRRVFVIVAVGITLLLPVTLLGEEKPTVQLSGLRVVGPGSGLNATELRAFNQPSGTTLALVVHAPENKMLVDVDDSKCSLAEFTDDRGKNLLDDVDWGAFPKISEDSLNALVEVTSKKNPSRDASRLFARGTIHVRMASSQSTEKIENLKLEVGGKAHVQQEVIQVMKVQAENDGLIIVLQITRKFKDIIRKVRFYTLEGEPADVWGWGSFTFGNAAQMEYSLDIRTIPKALKVEIDLWQELETFNLPFEIESGVGL